MINKMLFPIVRKKIPSLIAEEITSFHPIEYSKPGYGPWKRKIVIRGGLGHSFIDGFFFHPYSLVLIEYKEQLNPATVFTMCHTRDIEVLEEGLSEEEFKEIKDDWNRRIKEYESESI